MKETLYIIVPIFNVARYLQECLDSILAQTYENFICICINDGSTDGSEKIAQQYTKDTRFILINQHNSGVGQARNVGIEYALEYSRNNFFGGGGYIGFIDPDDVISRDYYENLIYTIESQHTLIAKSKDVYRFSDKRYEKNIFQFMQNKSKGYIQIIDNKNLQSNITVWSMLIKLEAISNLRFPKISLSEDLVFGVCANAIFGKVALTRSGRYFYRNREHSTRKQTILPKDCIEAFLAIYKCFKAQNLLETYTIPESIIAKDERYLSMYPHYLKDFKEALKDIKFSTKCLKQNPLVEAILNENHKEFVRKCKKGKRYFRIHINRHRIEIILFGKILICKDRD